MLEYALTRVLVLASREHSLTMLDNLLRDLPTPNLQRIRDAATIAVQYADTVIRQRQDAVQSDKGNTK